MNGDWSRRDVLRLAGSGLAGLTVRAVAGADRPPRPGRVTGHPEGARAGMEVLAAGGNAVDAAVTAALVASVVAVPMCGLGGYGGHMVIARPRGLGVVAIDFNTAAPQTAFAGMFPLAADGQVRGRVNEVGWCAAGVPGTLAGLQLALDRHGTWPLRRVLQPALHYASEGFEVPAGLANATQTLRGQLARDPGTARLLLPKGLPLQRGSRFRNPDLAAVLETLARDNSVEAFYRGEIAQRIAAEFHRHEGLVTAQDLAAYRAREVEPLELTWRGCSIRTAPLTAGGITVLETLAILRALDWHKTDPQDPRSTHLRVEALRLAWDDRLRLLGDPEHVPDVPVRRLLSADYARQAAARVQDAVHHGRPVVAETDGRTAGGTTHVSAADADGMMVALTLTHGDSFGAKVTVEGLGLILGHGMSRFDPRPDHPNAPGPGKRPLHNMCPTVVLKDGWPVLALGARGGRRIPNAVFEVLTAYVGRQVPLAKAVAAPRLHTEGGLDLTLERGWRATDAVYLRRVGYRVVQGPSATLDAVERDLQSGAIVAAAR